MQPTISVIVPVYNTAPWLRRCLDSICAQSYQHLEILCVNDGSTDNSAEILAEYAQKDERIKVYTQPNAGLSAARNTGLEHASGEWVTGVDSDDYIDLYTYEHAVSCIQEGIDVVVFGVLKKWENDQTQQKLFEHFSNNEIKEVTVKSARAIHVCFWNKLWRRNIVEEHEIQFPRGLVHEDDAFFYLFMPYAKKMALCAHVGYVYMQRDGSIMYSGQSEIETTQRYTRVLRYVYNQYQQRGVNPIHSEWYKLIVTRLYEYRFGAHSKEEIPGLQKLFYGIMREQKMLPEHARDYLFKRMIPVESWKRWFISRHLRAEIWRFIGIPLFAMTYKDGKFEKKEFILFSSIKSKLTSLLKIN